MVTVKKPGKIKVFEGYCPECGCEFAYTSDDTHLNQTHIECPCCGADLIHSHNEVVNEEETLFIYYELHSNIKDNLPKYHLTASDALDCIPKLIEGSAYVVNEISICKDKDGHLDIQKKILHKVFGPAYEEGNR